MIFTNGAETVEYQPETGAFTTKTFNSLIESVAGKAVKIDSVPLLVSSPPSQDEIIMLMTSIGFKSDVEANQENLSWDQDDIGLEVVH